MIYFEANVVLEWEGALGGNMETMKEKLSQIEQMRHKLVTGDVEGEERQHREGELTARERMS